MSSLSENATVGTLNRKHVSYDIWSLGDNTGEQSVGGEEIRGISCLLPRKKKNGKLYKGLLQSDYPYMIQILTILLFGRG